MKQLNNELGNDRYRKVLLEGMNDYFTFAQENYPHLESIQNNLIPFINHYTTLCGKTILFTGLNSAWMCRKSPDEKEIAIGEYQIKNAKEVMKEKERVDLTIYLFHHSLNYLWPVDKKCCRTYLNDNTLSILLTGHLHEPEGGLIDDYSGRLIQFQAGGLYCGSESLCPCRYHYITVDWDHDKVRFDFRAFDKDSRKWHVDAAIGSDGSKEFNLKNKQDDSPPPRRKNLYHPFFDSYKEYALNEHRFLAFKGFESTLRVPIEITNVYVTLHARIHTSNIACDTIEGKARLDEWSRRSQVTDFTIKEAFTASKQQHVKDMIILGDPGSGKTTLLKYILITILEGEPVEQLGISASLVPFFAPLRELKDPESEDFVSFIQRVCCLTQYGVTKDAFTTLLAARQGMILLDGLDEVADMHTRIKVCRWIDKARRLFVFTPFIITSRFAGYTEASRLEGSVMELAIQDLTPEEVANFLVQWFETVEVALHPGNTSPWKEQGRQKALELVENINKSASLTKLATNPLILQIIALIHWDRNADLPQRRVELYHECITVLMEKWQVAKGMEVMLNAREARHILQPVALWLHQQEGRRSAPLSKIIEIIKEPLENLGKSQIDPEALLKNIRDRSGVFVGYNETDYGFVHHSFQEYLAAEQIRNIAIKSIDSLSPLVQNYTNRWWREVIVLCCALDNPSVLEQFVKQIVPTDHFKSDISIVIDAVEDSITKPYQVCIEALENDCFDIQTKSNLIRILKKIGGSGENKVILALKDVAKSCDQTLALGAYEALKEFNAAEGIEEPSQIHAPALIKVPKDDSEMVLIPAGSFLYGSREDDKEAHSNEKPQRTIELPAFYMDVYPVTNRKYCMFLNQIHPDTKNLKKWIDLQGKFVNEKCRIHQYKSGYHVEEGYDSYPVIYVTWYGAQAYAEWAGKELPTEQQWEKAARGTDGLKYPWGNEFNKELCNSYESGIGHTTEVTRYPQGKSPYGCYDMAGNVWEWCSTKDGVYRVMRGGSWDIDAVYCRCAARLRNWPGYRSSGMGFRLSRGHKRTSPDR